MSRPKLTPLASLMPRKGMATQPEQVSQQASKQQNNLADEIASDRAVSEFVTQAAANSLSNESSSLAAQSMQSGQLVNNTTSEQSYFLSRERSPPPTKRILNKQADEQSGELKSLRENNLASEPVSKLAIMNDPAEYIDGPRSSVSFRMTERLKDRLRDYAHFSRRQKQDIMDQAVHEFLRREGY